MDRGRGPDLASSTLWALEAHGPHEAGRKPLAEVAQLPPWACCPDLVAQRLTDVGPRVDPGSERRPGNVRGQCRAPARHRLRRQRGLRAGRSTPCLRWRCSTPERNPAAHWPAHVKRWIHDPSCPMVSRHSGATPLGLPGLRHPTPCRLEQAPARYEMFRTRPTLHQESSLPALDTEPSFSHLDQLGIICRARAGAAGPMPWPGWKRCCGCRCFRRVRNTEACMA